MVLTDNRIHPLSAKKITLFLGSILLTNIVAAHKCFVCGPKNADTNVKNDNDVIPTCNQFNPSNPIFIRNCTSESRSCSIQTNGTVLTRTCEVFAFVDCKIANNVEYCYCNTDLCNKFHPTQADDEDFEGSGTEPYLNTEIPSVLQVPSTTPVTVISTSNAVSTFIHHDDINNTLLTFWILLFLIFCDINVIL